MTAKALDYAEKTLGVHSVYDEARSVQEQHARAMTDLADFFRVKRKVTSEIADREADVIVDERSKHPDHSHAAMERHLKTEFRRDAKLQELRGRLLDIDSAIDEAEFRSRSYEAQLRLLTARIEQLGGYFNYLAAVKTAGQSDKTATETM
jgi:hypothetical protein